METVTNSLTKATLKDTQWVRVQIQSDRGWTTCHVFLLPDKSLLWSEGPQSESEAFVYALNLIQIGTAERILRALLADPDLCDTAVAVAVRAAIEAWWNAADSAGYV